VHVGFDGDVVRASRLRQGSQGEFTFLFNSQVLAIGGKLAFSSSGGDSAAISIAQPGNGSTGDRVGWLVERLELFGASGVLLAEP